MHSQVHSASIQGIDGYPIVVEVDIRAGLPHFTIVGLPDAGVKESRERVLAALKNSGFIVPIMKTTINLAPAHIRKEGPAFDLPIAVGILASSEKIPLENLRDTALLGELGLNGELRPVRGVLPCALGLKKAGFRKIVLPKGNVKEAAMVENFSAIPVESLAEAVSYLTGETALSPYAINREQLFSRAGSYGVDFSEVRGQSLAKRALEIAAAGGHNVLLMGPPGSGKTLLARRLPTILPDLDFEEALESTKIHSVAGLVRPSESLMAVRPFRSPHHQVSDAALVGGGSFPRPGEVSLAHRGVLFLDEFPEFSRGVLESLRQPLEDRFVTVVRVQQSVRYPADFILVAAANPCPCGYRGSPVKPCTCLPATIEKYRGKISGPIIDRIDLHVEVPALKLDEITEEAPAAEPSSDIRTRVIEARKRQRGRLKELGLFENGQMGVRHLRKFCRLDAESKSLVKRAIQQLGLSARAYDRILRVSRTIADLAGKESIEPGHVAEAIGFRVLDRGESLANSS